ncbi:MAG: hypothetical protein ACREQB_00355 [Candidatus Binataceae bacterium]
MIRREIRLYRGVAKSISAGFRGLTLTVENARRSFNLLLRFGLCDPELNRFYDIAAASGSPLTTAKARGWFGGQCS